MISLHLGLGFSVGGVSWIHLLTKRLFTEIFLFFDHLANSIEYGAILNGQRARPNIAMNSRRRAQLNSLARDNVSINLARDNSH